MTTAPRRLRWFQFRLRTLLIVTCAVGAWLGWELRQADSLRRHTAAIVALGGQVELECSAWSLLRFVDRERFGLRAAKVEIPAAALGEGIPHLQALSGLRELRVKCDGACDLYPHFDRLTAALADTQVRPIADADDTQTDTFHRFARFAARVGQANPNNETFLWDLERWLDERQVRTRVREGHAPRDRYHAITLGDGSIAELLICDDNSWGNCLRATAILLVRDTFVDAKPLWTGNVRGYGDAGVAVPGEAVVDDFDGDGVADVGFEVCLERWGRDRVEHPLKLPGDARTWNCVYRIERDGFHPIRASEANP